MGQSQQSHSDPPIKKPKPTTSEAQDHIPHDVHEGQYTQEANEAQASATLGLISSTLLDSKQDTAQENMGSQGLLEDMVPFMVRNPTNNINSEDYSKSYCSTHGSPPTSPSLWTSGYSTSCYTVGLNSSI